ncbi:DUF6929 family protein [Flavobacterium agrisoli]|uniref:Uncharacterized protein n=1 Tax=Flavobacterium agrisoli TaxID=2793066 RepID=A0A934PLD3_9FLAO|nr:hypothetical protein [Flavobacterium agrisoli]MBK0369068.1 hypothetical protein [Flavobacterium agrisoli]
MEKFTLEILFHIIGIGAASGLFYQDNSLYMIGDNSGFLYEYSINSKELNKYPLIENPLESTPKKEKSDLESLTCFKDTLFVFGSGSTPNRNKMIAFDLPSKKKIQNNDLTYLYALMQQFSEIKPEDFNIEGAIFEGENWYLFNRGNGLSNKNTIFTIHATDLSKELAIVATPYKLPKIKGIRASFTDAVLVEDAIYFLATVENTKSTYLDGEILGSFIGKMDVAEMKIRSTQKISNSQKFEGITLYEKNKDHISFLLCEDKDDNLQESTIYKLNLPLK